MEYTTQYDETKGICIIRITGLHKRPEDSITIQNYTRNFGEERDCRLFLIDMTQAEFIGGTMDAFTTGTFPTDRERKQARHKYALLYSDNSPDQRFLETVSINRGYQVHTFTDVEKALKWLSGNGAE